MHKDRRQTVIKRLAHAFTLIVLTTSSLSYGQQSVLNYLYTEFNLQDQQRVMDSIQRGDLSADAQAELAYAEAQTLMTQNNIQPNQVSATAAGRWLANAAMLDIHAGRPDQGQLFLSEALNLLGADSAPFAPKLFNAVMARGVAAFRLDDLEQARDDFQWGQNILHRNEGVLTFAQAETVNWLTRVYLGQRELFNADTQQRFLLKLATEHYDENHPMLISIKQNVAEYLGQRAALISPLDDEPARAIRQAMFTESLTLLETLISTLEQTVGATSVKLIDPLRSLVRIRQMQGTAYRLTEAPLQRVLDILMAQESVDDEDLANAWLEFGDGMVLSGNPRSGNAYQEAWTLLEASSPDALSQFTEPVLLNPRKITPLLLERRPSQAPLGAELYADMTMTITERGRTKGVKITDRTVSAKYSRWARSRLSFTRFRPAMADGNPIAKTVQLRQPFIVASDVDPDSQPSNEPFSNDGDL